LAAVKNASVTLDELKAFMNCFQVNGSFALTKYSRPCTRILCIATASRRVGHELYDDVWLTRREKIRIQMLQRCHSLGERSFLDIAIAEGF
jgi:hypothetical protein